MRTSARKISRIAGQVISMGPAIGPLTRLFTRRMYAFIESSNTWDGIHRVDHEVGKELKFWLDNLDAVNGYHIKRSHAYTKVVYSDASGTGYGGFVVERIDEVIAQGKFSEADRSASSTFRELLAVREVLVSLEDYLKHESILWYSDNVNVVRILKVGSPKTHLQSLALQIFRICLRQDIRILAQWVPREENELADAISKHVDTDDWGIDQESFNYIQECFGNPCIDRFASQHNAKLTRFDAQFHCPGCETVNTFTANWGDDFNWWCPPISLIGSTLKHARICKASGILLVPEWTSAYFWPLLTPDGRKFYDFGTGLIVHQSQRCHFSFHRVHKL